MCVCVWGGGGGGGRDTHRSGVCVGVMGTCYATRQYSDRPIRRDPETSLVCRLLRHTYTHHACLPPALQYTSRTRPEWGCLRGSSHRGPVHKTRQTPNLPSNLPGLTPGVMAAFRFREQTWLQQVLLSESFLETVMILLFIFMPKQLRYAKILSPVCLVRPV